MLNNAYGFEKVYIACGYSDLRRGIDGFAGMIQQQFKLDPFQRGILFLFCGRKADRIKGLLLLRYRNNKSYSDKRVIPIRLKNCFVLSITKQKHRNK